MNQQRKVPFEINERTCKNKLWTIENPLRWFDWASSIACIFKCKKLRNDKRWILGWDISKLILRSDIHIYTHPHHAANFRQCRRSEWKWRGGGEKEEKRIGWTFTFVLLAGRTRGGGGVGAFSDKARLSLAGTFHIDFRYRTCACTWTSVAFAIIFLLFVVYTIKHTGFVQKNNP